MRQKILYVITKGNWGGAQKYVFELATHAPRSLFDVVVACGEGDILPKKLEYAGIAVQSIARLGRDINPVADSLVFFDLIKLFRKERPDVVHLNSSKIGGLGAFAARIAGVKKIIFTVHGFAFNENRSWLAKKVITFLSWLTIIFSTHVIFISQKELHQASAWLGIKHKANLIYNGIVPPQYIPKLEARKIIAEHIDIPYEHLEKKFIVGTIAELTSNKGLSYALEAFKDIPDAYYIIIGRGELYGTLKAYIHANNLSEKVFLAGFMQDASKYMFAFDVFLLPSLKEGVPYVLLEAGLAKRAVVATNVGGIPEIITDQTSGFLIEPKNTTVISHSISKLMHEDALRILCGDALQAHVTKTFNHHEMVEKTLALYA
jgi:glycosyltransferase involved in cell wall biosynthesis